MKLTAHIKLLPTPAQYAALLHTLEATNTACNRISESAWQTQTFKQFDLHRLCYRDIKDAFDVSAQIVVRAIAKVADAYKLDHQRLRRFAQHGSIAYDDRILSWKLDQRTVSIWTTSGRQTIPFVCGMRQWELVQTRRGETDLAYVNGTFYLLATCDVETPEPIDVEDGLGVDLGIVNLATDSDGQQHSGAHVETVRQRYQRRRDRLQRVGTKSAKRRLKKNSGKQRRFQSNTNHIISKQLAGTLWVKAKDTERGIALEDLTHIRQRTTVRKSQRAKHSNWTFFQLRTYITYKAQMAGVPVVLVDPRNTSRQCNVCGCVDKRNRPDQATFRCVECGHTARADVNAACNIRDRATVSWPMVSVLRDEVQAHLL